MDHGHKEGYEGMYSLLVLPSKLEGAQVRVREAVMMNKEDFYPISRPTGGEGWVRKTAWNLTGLQGKPWP